MTRAEYLEASAQADAHREYYGQFVDDAVRAQVVRHFGEERLVASTDAHFNDIPLEEWDACMPCVSKAIADKMRLMGDYPTRAGLTCVTKEAARQLVAARARGNA